MIMNNFDLQIITIKINQLSMMITEGIKGNTVHSFKINKYVFATP